MDKIRALQSEVAALRQQMEKMDTRLSSSFNFFVRETNTDIDRLKHVSNLHTEAIDHIKMFSNMIPKDIDNFGKIFNDMYPLFEIAE